MLNANRKRYIENKKWGLPCFSYKLFQFKADLAAILKAIVAMST